MSRVRGGRWAMLALSLLTAATVGACGPEPVGSPVALPSAGVESPGPLEPLGSLPDRMTAAAATAAGRGADVTIAALDRRTGLRVVGGVDTPVETASVAKLFIADDLLYRAATGELPLGGSDYDRITAMLESSDDSAANDLWFRHGDSEIVERTAARHALTGTVAPVDGLWWNTVTTASDLLTWYADLLDGTGGLDEWGRATIVGHLRAAGPVGADGYDQRFGLPDGLSDTTGLGVKQGWMCCLDGRWIHLSTGFVGDDERYVLVVLSRELVHYDADDDRWTDLPDTALFDVTGDASAQHARETVTEVVRTVFGSAGTH
ncbi:hypothetical protein LZP97_05455 [Rhodococcus sp. DMF-1]|uniref:hypothetical protein n=1 Tax=Rhodococcus TaxID=1827 RepID=UPI000660E41B|nr:MULTISPECIES: hypothetical protein [Rhodococcus]UIR37990.1 hypothetical protein LZP97_05455 [Rhodococcus sp. DMF-1]